MAMLKSKLYELELRKQLEEKQAREDSKTDIAGPPDPLLLLDQSRIKDLRTGVERSAYAGRAGREPRRFHRSQPKKGS